MVHAPGVEVCIDPDGGVLVTGFPEPALLKWPWGGGATIGPVGDIHRGTRAGAQTTSIDPKRTP
jgi:hypothetical protein